MLKLDLHVHTVFSGDAVTRPEEAILWARRAGLDGLAITDHDTLRGAQVAMRLAKRHGVLIVPGVEAESSRGHVLALGVSEPVKSGLSLAETVELVHDLGGLAVLAHPFSIFVPRERDPKVLRTLDAIEVVNARELLFEFSCWMARRLARALGKPGTGGSDAHCPEAIGSARTLIEAEPGLDDVLEAIRKGRTRPIGQRMGLRNLVRKWAYTGVSAAP